MVHDARIYLSTYCTGPPLPLPSIFHVRRLPATGVTTPTPTEPKNQARNRCVLGIGCPFLDGDLAALDFATLAESGHVAWAWVVERQLALYG